MLKNKKMRAFYTSVLLLRFATMTDAFLSGIEV